MCETHDTIPFEWMLTPAERDKPKGWLDRLMGRLSRRSDELLVKEQVRKFIEWHGGECRDRNHGGGKYRCSCSDCWHQLFSELGIEYGKDGLVSK